MKINFLCLAQDDIELTLAEPIDNTSNSNQYFISIGGLKDYSKSPMATMVIVGDWEYQAFRDCLTLAMDYLEKGELGNKKIFRPNNNGLQLLELEILSKPDNKDKVRFKLKFRQQQPVIDHLGWRRIKYDERRREGDLAFYASVEEIKKLGQLIAQLEYGEDDWYEVMDSSRDDWVLPHSLIEQTINSLWNYEEIISGAKKHVTEQAPQLMHEAWHHLIESLTPIGACEEIVACEKCNGRFLRMVGEHWRKQCVGCYYDNAPTAEQPPKNPVEHTTWLVGCDEE